MANLIITVIAIALVAVASLMGAYYGGSAFLNNTGAANASTFLNIGQQVAGAWTSFLTDNNNKAPDNWGCLSGNGNCGANNNATTQYLASIPTIPAMAGGIPAVQGPFVYETSDNHWYIWAQVGRPSAGNPANDPNATACLKLSKQPPARHSPHRQLAISARLGSII